MKRLNPWPHLSSAEKWWVRISVPVAVGLTLTQLLSTGHF